MAKGKVTFDQERCKGCGVCASVCPVKIIFLVSEVMNNKGYNVATVKEVDKCIGCASCGLMCPDGVITVERYQEDNDESTYERE